MCRVAFFVTSKIWNKIWSSPWKTGNVCRENTLYCSDVYNLAQKLDNSVQIVTITVQIVTMTSDMSRNATLAKIAEMALNCQNRQTVNNNSNERAKGPFGKRWLWPKWQNWHLIAKIAKLQTKIHMRWQRGPLESGDFSKNNRIGA